MVQGSALKVESRGVSVQGLGFRLNGHRIWDVKFRFHALVFA